MLTHESHALYVKGVNLFMDQFDDKVTPFPDIFTSPNMIQYVLCLTRCLRIIRWQQMMSFYPFSHLLTFLTAWSKSISFTKEPQLAITTEWVNPLYIALSNHTSRHSLSLKNTIKYFLFFQDLNALRDDIQELKPTLLVGVPRVYERIYEGSKIRTYLYSV